MLAISRCFSGSIAAKPRLEEPLRELLEELLLRELPDEFLELAFMPDLLPELLLVLSELLLDCDAMMTSFRKTFIFQKKIDS